MLILSLSLFLVPTTRCFPVRHLRIESFFGMHQAEFANSKSKAKASVSGSRARPLPFVIRKFVNAVQVSYRRHYTVAAVVIGGI